MRISQLIALAGALLPGSGRAQPSAAASTAFYYGQNFPRELATVYDQVVVQPEHVGDPREIAKLGAQPVAYFSVGELAPSQANGLPDRWILARNDAWASLVMDVASAEYRAHVLERFERLYARGYSRFFLDTLDSYQLAAKTDADREKQRRGLVRLLEAFKERHADVQLLVNRGFELLPDVKSLVSAVVAESLFDRYEAGTQAYTRVPAADRSWLLAKLREVRDEFRLPVIVIDYRPENERAAARETARRIAKLGFEPWVCNGMLSDVGIGRYEITPRRVLLLTDTPLKDGAPLDRGPLGWLAPILEYLGYVLELRSVHAGLPSEPLSGRYAGIITWFEGASLPSGYGAWLLSQIQRGTRVAIFGALGFDPTGAEARALGLGPATALEPVAPNASAILQRDSLIGFEATPPLHPIPGGGLRLQGPAVTPHLQVLDQAGHRADAIATAVWGGIAVSHVFALRGLRGERAWVLDPFAFLSRALALPVAPIPDVTTEDGRRLALFAIESEGQAERARLRGRPITASVLREQVLARFPWPHAMREPLRLKAAYPGRVVPGETDARGPTASLTQVQGMARESASGLEVPAPIAWDRAFVQASPEAYPYRQVIETLEFTDAPRRLKPAALHYHADVASSPAGLETLQAIYRWLETKDVKPIRTDDYVARVNAFREQVLARDLDGRWSVHGGVALRTLRLPPELGEADLAASSGVSSVRKLAQGTYLTFGPDGPRRLTFTRGASPLQVSSHSGATR